MKAVAVALVLIAGAAVVLWYGNTLNSWVLGGLIGGLAALLLSIPISLTLFSYLSKRHDERLQEEQEEISLARENDYPNLPARFARRPREVEGYVIADEGSEDAWQDEEFYAPRAPRALPAPAQQRQETVYQEQGSRTPERLPAPQQGTHVSAQRSQQQGRPKGKETTVLRSTTKKINALGYEPTSALSHHRSEALRTARLEAAKQKQDDVEVLPTNTPKKGLSVRPNQALAKQSDYGTSIRPPRPARQLPPQPTHQPRPQRRIVDSTPSQHEECRLHSSEGENAGTPQRVEPHTDYLSHQLPRTGPIRRSSQAGQSMRSSQEHEQGFEEENITGQVNRPLVRRAPYMYEDDPLRQELAQHLDAPAVRRSSRFDEDDEAE